jgi:hypothetical protein
VHPAALVAEIADAVAAHPGAPWLRVAVDGAPASDPHRFADDLVDPLRILGRAVQRVRADAYYRPASLRLERGRTDPDVYYEDWLDTGGLIREVLDPLGPGGAGRFLPSLRDPDTGRATRAEYVDAGPGTVLLLSGSLLLGIGLPLDFAVHFELTAPALARRTPAADQWTLPAFARYVSEVDPAAIADLVVRLDDPRHPAVLR